MLKRIVEKLKKSKNFNPKGSLDIPEGTKFIDGEPAVLYEVKSNAENAFLFMSPPKHQKSEYVQIEGRYGEIVKNRNQWELEMKTKNGETDNILAEFDLNNPTPNQAKKAAPSTKESAAGSKEKKEKAVEVVAKEFEYQDPLNPSRMIKHPHVLQVCTFEKIHNKDGSNYDINIKHLGYMFKEDLKRKEKFFTNHENIFPHPPRHSDIAQADMGDCFLLGTINAILAREDGPEYIMNMMQQQSDGSVIVRLFHPATKEPEYVRVENSTHGSGMYSLVGHEAPWVHILEKAYAGLGYRIMTDKIKNQGISADSKTGENYVLTPQSFLSSYGSGGSPDLATKILTGQDSTRSQIAKSGANYPLDPESRTLFTSDVAVTYIYPYTYDDQKKQLQINSIQEFEALTKKIAENFPKTLNEWCNEDLKNTSLYKILGEGQDPSVLRDWTIYINLLKAYYPKAYNDFRKISNGNLPIQQNFIPSSPEEFQKVIDGMKQLNPPPPKAALDLFEQYAHQVKEEIVNGEKRTIHSFPGKIGSGIYSADEYKLFDKLHQFNKEGKVLTAGTNATLKEEGLAPGHIYSITDVHKKIVNGKELLFVRLRNPWAITGRVYEPSTEDPTVLVGKESKKDNEFDLEINEFMKFYSIYSIGTIPELSDIELKVLQSQEIHKEKEPILYKHFKTMDNSMQQVFIDKLNNLNKADFNKTLTRQGLEDLYELAFKLEDNLAELKIQLRTANHENNNQKTEWIKKTMDEKKNMLAIVKSQFKTHLKANPAFPTIKQNAKLYLKSHKKNVLKQMGHAIKKTAIKFASIFGRKTSDDYLEIYKHHKAFQQQKLARSYFLKPFSQLDQHQKQVFITQFSKENDDMRQLVLKGQSASDLIEILNHTQHLSEQIQKQLDSLPGRIAQYEVSAAKGYEKEEIAKLYLKENLLYLANIMQIDPQELKSGVRDIIFKKDGQGEYQLQIQLNENPGVYSKPYPISKETIFDCATKHLAQKNRNELSDAFNDREFARPQLKAR